MDNGDKSPNKGNVYLAYDDPNLANPFDLTAFGPLSSGEPPKVVTGNVSGVGGGNATLNGTVDPNGFDVESCLFEYTTEDKFQTEGFTGAPSEPCVPDPLGIGSGTGPVAVSAVLSGLDPETRYRFRLVASNQYGSDGLDTDPGLFGPPVLTPLGAHPISYTEATLRAEIDPSGLQTKYHFEYGLTSAYGSTSTVGSLKASAGTTLVEVPVFGLKEGTTYHFALFAENDANAAVGPDQEFKTRMRTGAVPCPNEEFRTGRSAALPDCRAYELVTPADTRGATPYQTDTTGTHRFNNWLVDPSGPNAGQSLAFFVDGTLPGFDGNGLRDGYRAQRAPGEDGHPKAGWQSTIFSPSYAQAGGSNPVQQGVSADQEDWLWEVSPSETFAGTLSKGTYLLSTGAPQAVSQGSAGTDTQAQARFASAGGTHLIFDSDDQLEPQAAPAGTRALYDRTPTGTEVLSLQPGGFSFGAGQHATYLGATEDGSAVAFGVDGSIYLRRGGVTAKAADAPSSFAGISGDGGRVFYADGLDVDDDPATLFALDIGSAPTQIATESRFVNVSADGSHVYLTSKKSLDASKEGTEGLDNLYVWDGTDIEFIASLDPDDVSGSQAEMSLAHWSEVIAGGDGISGRARNPSRTTPDGEVLLFESEAALASSSGSHIQVFRYNAGEDALLCVSCDPTGAPASADARLQSLVAGAPTSATTLIPNVVDSGDEVFFESGDPLLPEDANDVLDVYKWQAPDEECGEEGGCLSLISSGQSDRDSHLYAMTPDGHDVFFATLEKLVGADIAESPSIYDARVEGGIPDPPLAGECLGDACKPQGSAPPALPAPASTGFGAAGDTPSKTRPCPKGKRRVNRGGKSRCVPKRSKGGKQRKGNAKRGGTR